MGVESIDWTVIEERAGTELIRVVKAWGELDAACRRKSTVLPALAGVRISTRRLTEPAWMSIVTCDGGTPATAAKKTVRLPRTSGV